MLTTNIQKQVAYYLSFYFSLLTRIYRKDQFKHVSLDTMLAKCRFSNSTATGTYTCQGTLLDKVRSANVLKW
jgi:hypothetical protein